MVSPTIIVDLSHHNPDPDWAELKAGGIVGVILKATEGTSFVDDCFAQRRLDAEAAGLIVCSYHFFHGDAQAEMTHYLETVVPRRGERVVIDHEAEASLAELEDAVLFVRQAVPDCQITIYGGHTLKEQLDGCTSDILAANTSLWIAEYTDDPCPTWPEHVWPVWSLWQFSDYAEVPGISCGVDGNRFNGSTANAIEWLGPADEHGPLPTPEPPGMVTVAIEVPPGIDISVVVNGKLIL